jgi:thioredoxin reductase (NADPH)
VSPTSFSAHARSAPPVPAPDRIHDIVIVGSSPAGYPAGISRGGALMTTTVVENYPGVREGTSGPLLVQDMCTQAKG